MEFVSLATKRILSKLYLSLLFSLPFASLKNRLIKKVRFDDSTLFFPILILKLICEIRVISILILFFLNIYLFQVLTYELFMHDETPVCLVYCYYLYQS